MRFGFDEKKSITGAGMSVRVFQIASLLPVFYIFLVSGYPAIITKKGLFSVLFSLGCSALPRWETLLFSWIYRLTQNEILVHFALLVFALIFGLAAGKLLNGAHRTARGTRVVLLVLIACDLVVRLLPLRFNLAFGLPCALLGFAVRLGCGVLILLDLLSDRRRAK